MLHLLGTAVDVWLYAMLGLSGILLTYFMLHTLWMLVTGQW